LTQFVKLAIVVDEIQVAVWTGINPGSAVRQRLKVVKRRTVGAYPVEEFLHGLFIKDKQDIFVSDVELVAADASADISVFSCGYDIRVIFFCQGMLLTSYS
jgi:hypothetical protein